MPQKQTISLEQEAEQIRETAKGDQAEFLRLCLGMDSIRAYAMFKHAFGFTDETSPFELADRLAYEWVKYHGYTT